MSAKTILIIDDDAVTRRLLHSALAAEHFDTLMAADAVGGLVQARTGQPDLILLDLGLPGGGGLLLLERLSQFPRLAVIPVIVISGLDRSKNEGPALAAGAVAYLAKPVLHQQVIAQVKCALATAA